MATDFSGQFPTEKGRPVSDVLGVYLNRTACPPSMYATRRWPLGKPTIARSAVFFISLANLLSLKARSLRQAARSLRLGLTDMLKLQVFDLYLFPFTIGSEGRNPKLHSEREAGSVT